MVKTLRNSKSTEIDLFYVNSSGDAAVSLADGTAFALAKKSDLTPKAISLSGTYANNIYAARMGCIVVVNININVSATDTPEDTVLTTGLPKSDRGTYTKDIYGTTMALSPSGELTIGTRADSNYITTSFAYIAND